MMNDQMLEELADLPESIASITFELQPDNQIVVLMGWQKEALEEDNMRQFAETVLSINSGQYLEDILNIMDNDDSEFLQSSKKYIEMILAAMVSNTKENISSQPLVHPLRTFKKSNG